MKTIQLLARLTMIFATGLVALGGDLYWDGNGTTAGAGAAPTGTWGTDNWWNSAADGTSTPGAWTAAETAIFSAGTDATGVFTVAFRAHSQPRG